MVICRDGTFSLLDFKQRPMTIDAVGTIGHYDGKKWTYVDAEGKTFSYVDGQKTEIEGKYSKSRNLTRKFTRIIRPDHIQYFVLENGTRRIEVIQESRVFTDKDRPIILDEFEIDEKDQVQKLFEQFFIEQTSELITYTVPNFPPIIFNKENGFLLELEVFKFPDFFKRYFSDSSRIHYFCKS